MSITTPGRSLSADMVTEVTATQLAPILLANLQFSTPVYLWTGYGTLTYNGVGYLGLGNLGTVSQVDETTDLAARGITLQLSGVPSALVSLALTENYQGRACSILFGALSPTAGLIASPVTVFSGKMDVMQITDDGSSAQITMTAENRLVDFRRSREVRYTDEEQQTLYSGDVGLEFVPAIQNKAIYWGNANPTNPIGWSGDTNEGTKGEAQ
jgi:hypothetical protein